MGPRSGSKLRVKAPVSKLVKVGNEGLCYRIGGYELLLEGEATVF